MEITLTLKIKDVELTLSPADARGLYDALGKLVGDKEVRVTERIYERSPWRWYYSPETWRYYAGAPSSQIDAIPTLWSSQQGSTSLVAKQSSG